MSDDPNSVADALDRFLRQLGRHLRKQEGWWDSPEWEDVLWGEPHGSGIADMMESGTAARLLRDHADTTNRLTALDREFKRAHVEFGEIVDELVAERDDLAARLSALTDAIGDPNELRWVDKWSEVVAERDNLAVQLSAATERAQRDRDERDAWKAAAVFRHDDPAVSDALRAAHGVQPPDSTPPPTEPFTPPDQERHFVGQNSERQGVGLPGHCDRCAEVGHAAAHPKLGCSDVGCTREHNSTPPPSVCPTCGSNDPEVSRLWVNSHRGGFCPDPWHQQ